MINMISESESRGMLVSFLDFQVKQIMEEAVTRKFVHEDSSHIFSFCACVLHGLKRRAAGFLRSNKLAALFMKMGKMFPPAEELCRKVQELEQIIENKQNQGQTSQESVRKQPRPPNLSPLAVKHLWIRAALTEKLLDKIVLYLVENSSKFYEREALLRDPVDGPILASLLVGPCALEYTKAKTANHFWTDPSADELVQRHRIHSGHCRQDSPTKRPALVRCPAVTAFLSCFHTKSFLVTQFLKTETQTAEAHTNIPQRLNTAFVSTITLKELLLGGTVVLVSQDGIQRPPLRFPKGGHLLQFLTCLETGLLPRGQLDPPLWSQRGKGKVFPKLRKRSPHESSESFSDKEEDEATDYVFRIIFPGIQEFGITYTFYFSYGFPSDCSLCSLVVNMMLIGFLHVKVAPELMDQTVNMWQPTPRKSSCSSCLQNGSSEGGLPNGCNHDRAPLKLLCETMKHQIISRAFYGWLAYCRHLSTVRTHLSALVNPAIIEPDIPYDARSGLSAEVWKTFLQDSTAYEEKELLRLVYYGGVEPTLRKEVWPFLLGHYHFSMSLTERKEMDEQVRACYEQTMSEWLGCEAIVRQREKEQHAAALAKCASGASVDRGSRQDSTISTDSSQSSSSEKQSHAGSHSDSNSSTQVFGSVDEVDPIESEPKPKDEKLQPKIPNGTLPNCTSSPDSGHPSSRNFSVTSVLSDCSPSTDETSTQESGPKTAGREPPSGDQTEEKTKEETPLTLARPVAPALELCMEPSINTSPEGTDSALSEEEPEMGNSSPKPDSLAVTGDKNDIASPVSSIGTTYSQELVDLYTLNLHRIDKDVHRCDRNYWYFTPENLEKLRNIMCSYVWQHLDIGYVQGMCDLLAPLLVILDDEAMAFSCFTELMKRMNQNFPHGGAMDTHFANMRSLIQILDSELFELMQQNGDYTHFYFCYRWFLLDFKREMVYDDVFSVWETIWAARFASSEHFVLFITLALVELYRDIILENNMDFTDIIKFFNEMAEHHDVPKLLLMARELVNKVQILIENK
uniref:Small G protein signaling modulator 1-like n=1 Tax=Sinocyclocheilus grahami TaxID=75366 RepID=A0A672MJT0_SINGR